MGTIPNNVPREPPNDKATLEELQAIRRELVALRKLFDTFAGVFLNAKFPFGKADRSLERRP